MSLPARVFAGLLAGLVLGIALGPEAPAWLIAVVEPVGTLWVNAIRMTVIPLVVALLIASIAGTTSKSAGRLGGRTLFLFLLFIAASTLFAALTAPPLLAGLDLDPAVVESLRASAAEAVPEQVELPPFTDWFTGLIPTNPLGAAAEGALLPLLVFVLILAFALARLGREARRPVTAFFEAVRDAMLVVVGWVLWVAPLGVFCLVLPLAARFGADFAGALGYLLGVICGLIVLATLGLYPVAHWWGGVPLGRFAAACAPAQAVGFTTRSSLASLPPLIEEAERTLELPAAVAGLALPLAVSVFKFASPIARFSGTIFVAGLYGVALDPAAITAIAAAIGLLSFYSPGVPSGGLFVMTPVYLAFGLPVEGVGLLIAIDLIPDMFITASNVTADMTVATLVARGGGSTWDSPDPASVS